MWEIQELKNGLFYTISVLAKGMCCEAKEFLDDLAKSHELSFTAIFRRLDNIANNGVPRNKTQYEIVRTLRIDEATVEICEIKVRNIRLFCFINSARNSLIILTHGMKKGSRKEQSHQINRAENLVRMYFEQIL